jgi:RNA polymerase sigma-70 factor (ECF subfamily)
LIAIESVSDDIHGPAMEARLADDTMALVAAARQGDEAAQRGLILAYQERIAGFVYTLLGSTTDIEDVTQQVLLRMLSSLPRLRDDARFEAWLFRLARNVCISHLRRSHWRRLFSPLERSHTETVEAPRDYDPALADALEHALDQLSPTDRAILALAADGRSHHEMQRSLGKSLSAIKVMLHRARERLKRHYHSPDHA